MKMKQVEKLQAKARQRFGFCGSLIIHFILFIVLAFSGIFAWQAPQANADTVVYFDAGGGGGGGGDADQSEEEAGEEQVEDVVEEETITLPDGKVEHKQVVHHVVKKAASSAHKKGSGSGTGGGHGTGHGTGTGSGTGAGSGSGSGGGSGSGHGSGVGDGNGGIATAPKVPARVSSTAAPYYPPALRDAGIEGRVVVRGVIGTDGRVESAQVVRSSGNSTLDNNALSAFYKWRFSAARNDAGQKVRCYFTQGFPFMIQYK